MELAQCLLPPSVEVTMGIHKVSLGKEVLAEQLVISPGLH